MRFALFKEVPKRERRKKRKLNTGGAARRGGPGSDDSSGDDSDADGSDEEPAPQRMQMPSRAASAAPQPDNVWGESQDTQMADGPAANPADALGMPPPPASDGTLTDERYGLELIIFGKVVSDVALDSSSSDSAYAQLSTASTLLRNLFWCVPCQNAVPSSY